MASVSALPPGPTDDAPSTPSTSGTTASGAGGQPPKKPTDFGDPPKGVEKSKWQAFMDKLWDEWFSVPRKNFSIPKLVSIATDVGVFITSKEVLVAINNTVPSTGENRRLHTDIVPVARLIKDGNDMLSEQNAMTLFRQSFPVINPSSYRQRLAAILASLTEHTVVRNDNDRLTVLDPDPHGTDACNNCQSKRGSSPFRFCLRLPLGDGGYAFNGACTHCVFHSLHNQCSLSSKQAVSRGPRKRKAKEISTSQPTTSNDIASLPLISALEDITESIQGETVQYPLVNNNGGDLHEELAINEDQRGEAVIYIPVPYNHGENRVNFYRRMLHTLRANLRSAQDLVAHEVEEELEDPFGDDKPLPEDVKRDGDDASAGT